MLTALSSLLSTSSQGISLKHATLHDEVASRFSLEERYGPSRSAASSQDEDGETDVEVSLSLRVGIIIHRGSEGFAARASNLHSYLELNRHVRVVAFYKSLSSSYTGDLQFLSQASYTLPTDPESRSLIDAKAQISSDSIVGHTTKIGERTSIKKSVIGKHCVIGKMVRIVGCVILDHCVVADG